MTQAREVQRCSTAMCLLDNQSTAPQESMKIIFFMRWRIIRHLQHSTNFNLAAAPLKKLLGCKLLYPKHTNMHSARVKKALEQLSKADCPMHKKAEAGWKELQKIHKEAQKEKKRANNHFYT